MVNEKHALPVFDLYWTETDANVVISIIWRDILYLEDKISCSVWNILIFHLFHRGNIITKTLAKTSDPIILIAIIITTFISQ